MEIINFDSYRKWISKVANFSSSSKEEEEFSLYLFNETLKKIDEKKITPNLCNNIAAASIILSLKFLRDDRFCAISPFELSCYRPCEPPFMNTKSIVKFEKVILELFDYNLLEVVNKCFKNIINMEKLAKEIKTNVEIYEGDV